MAMLPILAAADPHLPVISKPVKPIDDRLCTLIADLFEPMYDVPGVGLATQNRS